MTSLERELRGRFEVRTERFSHSGFEVEMLLPRSAEELIDASDFNVDERLPYWAELWPSARALARLLLERPAPSGRAVELGCGVALPSLALRSRGVEVLATDYYADALAFARAGAERNRIAPPDTLLLDWRHPPADLGRFDLVLAADVLYERRNAEALASLLPRLLAPGGSFLLADPGRVYLGEFVAAMEEAGWEARPLPEREEASPAGEHLRVRVRLLEMTPQKR